MKLFEFVQAPAARFPAHLVLSKEHVGHKKKPHTHTPSALLVVNYGCYPATYWNKRLPDSSHTPLATTASVAALNFFGIAKGPNCDFVGRRKQNVVQYTSNLNADTPEVFQNSV